MDNDNRLQLAKIRLQNLKEERENLQDVAAAIIAANIQCFVTGDEYKRSPPANPLLKRNQGQAKKNPSSKLSDMNIYVRRLILNQLLMQRCRRKNGDFPKFNAILNAFRFLFTTLTREINLERIMSFCPPALRTEQLIEVMHLIATHAPNVKLLTFSGMKESSVFFSKYEKILCPDVLNSIGRMEKLAVLQIRSYKVKFSDLSELCQKLKNLVHLDTNIAFESVEDLNADFYDSFSRLRKFLFRGFQIVANDLVHTQNFTNRLTELCIEHLPSLEVVHNFANCAPCDEYCLPSISRISGLQHLRIQLRNLQPELLQWFPNVTHLKIDLQSSQNIDKAVMTALLQFKKIKSLVLSGCSSAAILERFLTKFRHQLHTLGIESILNQTGNSFKFETINKACPNLETLILRNVNMIDSAQVKNFAELKNLQWIKPEAGSTDFCFSNVLLAPKLECLEMLDAEMSLVDLKNASTLIAERKILNNLKTFRFVMFPSDVTNNVFGHLEAMSEFVKIASTFLPKLTQFMTLRAHSFLPPQFQGSIHADSTSQFFELFYEMNDHDSMLFELELLQH